MCFRQKKVKPQQQQKIKQKSLPEPEINPGPLASKADALPLDHRVN